jgi:predicted transposase YbfD/YdcC
METARWLTANKPLLKALGLGWFSYSTLRRLAKGVDVGAVETAAYSFLASRLPPQEGGEAWAVDGKELTGSVGRETPATRLVCLMDHRGVVLAQAPAAGASHCDELGALPVVLAGAAAARPGGAAGVVATFDANFAHRGQVACLEAAGMYWAVKVKGNEPTLLTQLAHLPWDQAPKALTRQDKGHARLADIAVKSIEFTDSLPCVFPTATMVLQVTSTTHRPNQNTKDTGSKKKRKTTARRASGKTTRRGKKYIITDETAYILTNLPPETTTPDRVYNIARTHWSIENRLHHVRDTTFAEDASQERTGNAPHLAAALNNIAISLIRLAHGTNANIRAATQRARSDPNYLVSLLSPPQLE